jgi:hypothetical protein
MMLSRRGFVGGLIGALAAPAIVRVESIMPVRVPSLIAVTPLSLAANIRNELLPGLFDITNSYNLIPRQWDRVFQQKGLTP